MYPEDPRMNPMRDSERRPSQILLILMAVGIAIVVLLLGQPMLYLAKVWKAQPLG